MLNFPDFKFNIRDERGHKEIFDPIRRKYVALGPEELVRQNMTRYLTECKHYPLSRLANEVSITINGMNKRCDTLVYSASLSPLLIIEYKAPSIILSQEVFDQILTYNSVLQVPFLLVSNGLQHIFCQILPNNEVRFFPDIVPYNELTSLI